MEKKLLAIGNAYVDENFFGLQFPDDAMPAEREFAATGRELVPGGSALNFARLCTELGLPTEFVGKIGTDEIGQLLLRLTQGAGIEPAFILDPEVRTNISVNMINESGKACMAWDGSANQSLTSDEVMDRVEPILPHIEYLYFGGCFKLPQLLPAFTRLTSDAKSHHAKVIVDHNRVPHKISAETVDAIRKLALAADYYLPSKDEFCELWEVDSIEAGLHKLHTQSSATIIVKDAEHGAVTLDGDKFIRVPAFPVKVSNPIGAGDSFNAGFIAARANGMNLRESMRLGCAVAALKISRATLPTFAEAQALARQA